MAKEDKEKTAFFVEEVVFCYRKMPFGLKNTGATYQKLVDKVFSKQIRKNLETYVDVTVIKSTSEEGMLSDIQETFKRSRSINIKLNSKKCSFGVEEGLFLGHLIAKQGIKANPLKIKAEAERSLPFFKVLKRCKGKKKIHWTDEADKAFKEMKKFIQALLMLIAPRAGETLIMYLTASKESTNVTLLKKRSKGQILIYFVSRVLQGAKLNYPVLEKLILALVHAARRLRRYFQAHTIMVLKGTPIKQALTGPKKTRRVAKWAIKLGKHDIVFLKRDERETPADFLPEIPFDDSEKRVKDKEVSDPINEWKLYIDRASSSNGVGAGLMLIDPTGKEYTYALRFKFETTNNEVEYEELLVGLRIAQEMEIKKVAIFLDSKLLVNQIKGTYVVKQLSIKSYLQKVKTALKGFEGYTVEHVRRNQNKKADALSKLASMTFEHLIKEVLVEVLAKRLIEEKEVLKTNKIIKEIYEGSCGFNVKPRSMVVRITKQGYYWPSIHMEAVKTIQDCDKCEEQSAIRKAGMDEAIIVESTWPFSHWGIHILGPLLMAPGGLQFEVPRMISSKEEKHFKEGIFSDFCKGLKITQIFSPIMKNMEIMHDIEKQLVRSQQSYVDILPKELWVHRTLPRNNQKETPFSLTYRSEAVVLIVKATDDREERKKQPRKARK
nr:reverse transcriptase domain-containing protein [Tanacetum cinerariifolium]